MAVNLRKKLVYNHVQKSVSLGLCLCYLHSIILCQAGIHISDFEEVIVEAVMKSEIFQNLEVS